MNPKKPNDSVKKTAQELQLDEIFLQALITAYWKKVRKEFAQINKNRLEIQGLGCFDLKYFKIKYVLRDTLAFIQYHQKQNSEKSFAILQSLNRKLEVLQRANELAHKRVKDETDKRNKRKKYILEKSSSLEK